jgi:ABC-2 type transport system permease protein
LKNLRDILLIFWLYVQESRSALGYFLLSAVALPVGMLLFTSGVAEGKPSLRLLAGSIVFALSMLSVVGLGFTLLEDRFRGRLKLIITSPVSPRSYLLGVFLFALCQGLLSSILMLLFASVIHLRPHLAFSLLAIAVLSTIPLAAIALISARYAHSIQQGALLNDLIGTGTVLVCPVFYAMPVLPAPLQYLSRALPPTYAADAFWKVLSDRAGIGFDLLVLGLMSAAVVVWGDHLLPWRDK